MVINAPTKLEEESELQLKLGMSSPLSSFLVNRQFRNDKKMKHIRVLKYVNNETKLMHI